MDEYLKTLELDLSDALIAAKALLGYKLIFDSPLGKTSGYIVETEAYHSYDPASQSYRGQTERNSSMFKESGTIYVYFTYGMHYCLNIITGPIGDGQGVLIRALQPIEGTKLMTQRRHSDKTFNLTNGPAKLTQAMAIDKSLNGSNILDGPIKIQKGFMPSEVVATPRIGISKAVEYPWRFYIKDNDYVSKVANKTKKSIKN